MSQIPPPNDPYGGNDPYQAKMAPQKPDAWGEPTRTSGKAIASLILSFFSIFLCGIPGIVALILGFLGLSDIRNSQGRITGSGFATSGIVIAFISFAMLLFVVPVLLLLPAINAAREAARRNGCLSNTRQLALGIANHEAATARFPLGSEAAGPFVGPGAALPGTSEGDTAAGYSWQVKTLPYIEERILFDDIQRSSDKLKSPAFENSVTARGQHPAQRQLVAVRCPSFSGDIHATAPEYEAGLGDVAAGNYVGIPGTYIRADGTLEENGILVSRHWNRAGGANPATAKGLKLREISDGISKTVLLCESREQRYASWYDGQSTWVTALRTDVNENNFKQGQARFGGNFPEAPAGAAALNVGPDRRGAGQDYFPAEKFPGQQARQWGPSSQHSGGVVLHAFADAHAQAISADIDPTVYMRLVTRNGGEPIDPAGF